MILYHFIHPFLFQPFLTRIVFLRLKRLELYFVEKLLHIIYIFVQDENIIVNIKI